MCQKNPVPALIPSTRTKKQPHKFSPCFIANILCSDTKPVVSTPFVFLTLHTGGAYSGEQDFILLEGGGRTGFWKTCPLDLHWVLKTLNG